jgi:predicted transcriptional regulator
MDRKSEDVAYEVELRASIERGLADSDAGRVVAVEDLACDCIRSRVRWQDALRSTSMRIFA